MINPLHSILTAAQARRDAADWGSAIRLFQQAMELAPEVASIKHNLAICYFGSGDLSSARAQASAALILQPDLWQSRALLAKIYRASGAVLDAETEWHRIIASDPRNAMALLGLADLAMNEFGDPETALSTAESLASDPASRADAELTRLMASLYVGNESSSDLSARLCSFSRAHLRLPLMPVREPREGRRRIGLISPLFSASPVYYLTYSTFFALGLSHDLVMFNRGNRDDHATSAFRSLASEWHNVPSLEPGPLAEAIYAADIDILFDLGGWSDARALTALSAKPAPRMYKWVGGQSATTGLEMFDGWIGDRWQSPRSFASLYAEPLINMSGGYSDYTPPPALAVCAGLPKKGVGLVGNPAKIGPATMRAWPGGVERVTLIDRRYIHDRARERVTDLLARANIRVDAVVAPKGHEAYLEALARCEAMVNTQPYSAGLTAVEAHWLGVRVLEAGRPGRLFCSRHHLSHARTRGQNPRLASQILKLVST